MCTNDHGAGLKSHCRQPSDLTYDSPRDSKWLVTCHITCHIMCHILLHIEGQVECQNEIIFNVENEIWKYSDCEICWSKENCQKMPNISFAYKSICQGFWTIFLSLFFLNYDYNCLIQVSVGMKSLLIHRFHS